MPTPKPVSKKLREILGAEAAETMVDWLDGLDERRDVLRHEMRADMAELRQEIRADMAELRQEMATIRAELRAGFVAVDAKIAQRNADLMKWMIGFWLASFVGIVGAVLALARVIH